MKSIFKKFNFKLFIQMAIPYGGLMMIFNNWSLSTAVLGGAAFGLLMSFVFTLLNIGTQKKNAKSKTNTQVIDKELSSEILICYSDRNKKIFNAIFIFGMIFFGLGTVGSLYMALKDPRMFYLFILYIPFNLLMYSAWISVKLDVRITDKEIKGVRKSSMSKSQYSIYLADIKDIRATRFGNIKVKTNDGESHVVAGASSDDFLRFGEVDNGIVKNEVFRNLYRLVEEIKRRVDKSKK